MALSKDRETITRYKLPRKNRLSENQLKQFHERLLAYMKTGRTITGEPGGKFIDYQKYLEDAGATKNGAVVIKERTKAEYDSFGKLRTPSDCDPVLYEQIWEDIRQYEEWISKNKV